MSVKIRDQNPCPSCQKNLSDATCAELDGAHPIAGDPTVCAYCHTWLVFKDDLSVREMTGKEVRELKPSLYRQLTTLTTWLSKRQKGSL